MEEKDEGQQPVEQLIANRRAKLDALYELGKDPYPRRYRVEESISEARGRFEDLAVDRNAAIRDPAFGFAARTEAGARHRLGDAHGFAERRGFRRLLRSTGPGARRQRSGGPHFAVARA